MPHGPARLGPMRFCMSEMTLRSNQTMNITRDQQEGEGDDDLDDDDEHDAEVDAVGEQRVASGEQPRSRTVSIRMSVTGWRGVDEVGGADGRAG